MKRCHQTNFKKLKGDSLEYLLGLIGLLIAALGYNVVKRRGAEALLQNTETKEKLLGEDAKKNKNDSVLSFEDLVRKGLEKNSEDKKKDPVDPKDFN